MKTANIALVSVVMFGAGFLVANVDIPSGTAQEAVPTKSKGIKVAKLGIVPKASMTRQTGLEGYVLQLRLATVEPGGQIARHKHTTRPGLVYTLDGSWIEGRPGGEREYPAGENIALVEDADTEHWFFNRSQKPAKVLICDLDNR